MRQLKINSSASQLLDCQRSFVFTFCSGLLICSCAAIPHFFCQPSAPCYFLLVFSTNALSLLFGFLAGAVTVRRSLLAINAKIFSGDPLVWRNTERLEQACSQITFWGLIFCYAAVMTKTAFFHNGFGDWVAGWLEASARDAHIGPATLPYPYTLDYQHWVQGTMSVSALRRAPDLHFLVKCLVSILAIVLPWRQLTHVAALLTSFVERASAFGSGLADSLIDAVGASLFTVQITDRRPGLTNVMRSLSWLGLCYAGLFWIFGFCPGWLGMTISNFLAFSVRNANFVYFDMGAMRPFLASVIALYAAVPTAVMTSVFLPPRKLDQLTITDGAILFSEFHLLSLNFRLLRSFSDVQSVTMVADETKRDNSSFTISFRSGGKFECLVRQVEERMLSQLLTTLDTQAPNCFFDREVISFQNELAQKLQTDKYGPSRPVVAGADKFKSTKFSPHACGEKLHMGRLRVIKTLATESLAATYLIRNADNELCVLRQLVVPFDTEKSSRLKDQFKGEYEVLRKMDTGSLARVFDTFEQDKSLYVLMEHVKGESLQQLVERRGAQPESIVISWAEQIAETMAHLQSRQPGHNNLNPENLLVDSVGVIRLIDFGAESRLMNAITGMLMRKSSQHVYMAPELLRGQPTMKSDIYSFGCVLSLLLTGKPSVALQSTDLSDEDRMLSPWMIEFIGKCTRLDEASRMASFDEVLTTLRSLKSQPLTLAQRKHLLGESVSERSRVSQEHIDLIALFSDEYLFLEKLKASAKVAAQNLASEVALSQPPLSQLEMAGESCCLVLEQEEPVESKRGKDSAEKRA